MLHKCVGTPHLSVCTRAPNSHPRLIVNTQKHIVCPWLHESSRATKCRNEINMKWNQLIGHNPFALESVNQIFFILPHSVFCCSLFDSNFCFPSRRRVLNYTQWWRKNSPNPVRHIISCWICCDFFHLIFLLCKLFQTQSCAGFVVAMETCQCRRNAQSHTLFNPLVNAKNAQIWSLKQCQFVCRVGFHTQPIYYLPLYLSGDPLLHHRLVQLWSWQRKKSMDGHWLAVDQKTFKQITLSVLWNV